MNAVDMDKQVTMGRIVLPLPQLLLRLEFIENEPPVKLDTKPHKSQNFNALNLLLNLLLSLL